MNPDADQPEALGPSQDAESDAGSTALFRSIVADAEEGVVVLQRDGTVSYTNAAAEFLLGRRREELTGEMFGFPRAATDHSTAINVVSRDGRLRLVELRAEPLAAGPSGGLLLRLKDVTTYHEDVSVAREEVRQRDEFLAMLSHELRNPLAAIRSAAVLLARSDVGDEARLAAGETFDRQFKHLRRLLDDLLDIPRISRGKLEIVKERVDLNQVVRDAVEEASPIIASRGHRLRVDLPSHAVWVEGDPTRLEQVVVNLLNNAAKFTPPTGNVSVTVAVEGGEAEIRVRDDGPGIAADLLPHVFEPFIQGEQSAARSEGGLGIGLSLVQAIVALHGGAVCVDHNPDGPGVSFSVKLSSSEAGAGPPAGPRAERLSPLRILLVEDGCDARRMLKQILALDGHVVVEAGDGPAGLAALLEGRPDVALVDVGLPGFDGHELARRARRDVRGRSIRLVALTGYGMPEDVAAARAAGFDNHMVKPLNYPDLCELLQGIRTDRAASDGSGHPGATGR